MYTYILVQKFCKNITHSCGLNKDISIWLYLKSNANAMNSKPNQRWMQRLNEVQAEQWQQTPHGQPETTERLSKVLNILKIKKITSNITSALLSKGLTSWDRCLWRRSLKYLIILRMRCALKYVTAELIRCLSKRGCNCLTCPNWNSEIDRIIHVK